MKINERKLTRVVFKLKNKSQTDYTHVIIFVPVSS